MTVAWSAEELRLLDAAVELEIAVERSDGGRRPWVPIWVVCTDGRVFVRSWHRRDTGWFGRAVRSLRGRVRVPGLETPVTITDVGSASSDVTDDVNAAYWTKYGGGAGSMVTSPAAATTLELHREDPAVHAGQGGT